MTTGNPLRNVRARLRRVPGMVWIIGGVVLAVPWVIGAYLAYGMWALGKFGVTFAP